jgi:hypothetical protein
MLVFSLCNITMKGETTIFWIWIRNLLLEIKSSPRVVVLVVMVSYIVNHYCFNCLFQFLNILLYKYLEMALVVVNPTIIRSLPRGPLKHQLWKIIQFFGGGNRRNALDTTLCDKVCQWLTTGQWLPPPIKLTATIQLKYCWNWR